MAPLPPCTSPVHTPLPLLSVTKQCRLRRRCPSLHTCHRPHALQLAPHPPPPGAGLDDFDFNPRSAPTAAAPVFDSNDLFAAAPFDAAFNPRGGPVCPIADFHTAICRVRLLRTSANNKKWFLFVPKVLFDSNLVKFSLLREFLCWIGGMGNLGEFIYIRLHHTQVHLVRILQPEPLFW